MTNCNELPGRLKDLCRGHDDDGNPVLTPAKRSAYRNFFHGDEFGEHVRMKKLSAEQRKEAHLNRAREVWRKLHLYAGEHADDWDEAAAKKWLTHWETTIPKYGCSCRKGWKKHKQKLPPQFASAEDFFVWSVGVHNLVNSELGKPQFPVETALEWYRSMAH